MCGLWHLAYVCSKFLISLVGSLAPSFLMPWRFGSWVYNVLVIRALYSARRSRLPPTVLFNQAWRLCVSRVGASFRRTVCWCLWCPWFLRELLCLRVRLSPLLDMLWPLPSPIEISHPKELALEGGQLPQVCSTLACHSKVHSWFVGIVYFVMVYELEVLVLL